MIFRYYDVKITKKSNHFDEKISEMYDWLEENIGYESRSKFYFLKKHWWKQSIGWCVFLDRKYEYKIFRFGSKKDALIFKLIWVGI